MTDLQKAANYRTFNRHVEKIPYTSAIYRILATKTGAAQVFLKNRAFRCRFPGNFEKEKGGVPNEKLGPLPFWGQDGILYGNPEKVLTFRFRSSARFGLIG